MNSLPKRPPEIGLTGEEPKLIGPIRNPDACVLACPDCTCRQRLNEHLAQCRRTGDEGVTEPTEAIRRSAPPRADDATS